MRRKFIATCIVLGLLISATGCNPVITEYSDSYLTEYATTDEYDVRFDYDLENQPASASEFYDIDQIPVVAGCTCF